MRVVAEWTVSLYPDTVRQVACMLLSNMFNVFTLDNCKLKDCSVLFSQCRLLLFREMVWTVNSKTKIWFCRFWSLVNPEMFKIDMQVELHVMVSSLGLSFLRPIFFINSLVVWSIKCKKKVKKSDHCSPKLKIMFSNVLLCPQPRNI